MRFALCPRATVVVAENRITFPFDINHIPIRTYEHLGSDLGRKEAARFKADLAGLIRKIMSQERTDSPVFTFLPALAAPRAPAEESVTPTPEDSGPTMNALKRQALEARDRSDFQTAIALWQQVRDAGPKDDYVVQQLALATYKSKQPSEIEALQLAKEILNYLWPHDSLDPETLGLWAAVQKRFYEKNGDRNALDEAITATERGFVLRQDYYNGINLAFLLDTRAAGASHDLSREDHAQAPSVRRRVTDICRALVEPGKEMDEKDRYWVLATLQEAAVGLGDEKAAADWALQAREFAVAPWMIETTNTQLEKLRRLLAEIEAK